MQQRKQRPEPHTQPKQSTFSFRLTAISSAELVWIFSGSPLHSLRNPASVPSPAVLQPHVLLPSAPSSAARPPSRATTNSALWTETDAPRPAHRSAHRTSPRRISSRRRMYIASCHLSFFRRPPLSSIQEISAISSPFTKSFQFLRRHPSSASPAAHRALFLLSSLVLSALL